MIKKITKVNKNQIQYDDIHKLNQNFQSTAFQVNTQSNREIANKI